LVWVYALLCGVHLNAADCTLDTAVDAIRFPDARDEQACARRGMMTIASLAIQARPDEYWRFVCLPAPPVREAAGPSDRAATDPPTRE
jgi:hypothetical protein